MQAAVFRAVAAEKWNADKAIAEQRLETALKLSQDSTERKGTAFEQERCAVVRCALCCLCVRRARYRSQVARRFFFTDGSSRSMKDIPRDLMKWLEGKNCAAWATAHDGLLCYILLYFAIFCYCLHARVRIRVSVSVCVYLIAMFVCFGMFREISGIMKQTRSDLRLQFWISTWWSPVKGPSPCQRCARRSARISRSARTISSCSSCPPQTKFTRGSRVSSRSLLA